MKQTCNQIEQVPADGIIKQKHDTQICDVYT